jgi:hypothetical protein
LRHAIIQRSTKEALHAQELSHPTQILIWWHATHTVWGTTNAKSLYSRIKVAG